MSSDLPHQFFLIVMSLPAGMSISLVCRSGMDLNATLSALSSWEGEVASRPVRRAIFSSVFSLGKGSKGLLNVFDSGSGTSSFESILVPADVELPFNKFVGCRSS